MRSSILTAEDLIVDGFNPNAVVSRQNKLNRTSTSYGSRQKKVIIAPNAVKYAKGRNVVL